LLFAVAIDLIVQHVLDLVRHEKPHDPDVTHSMTAATNHRSAGSPVKRLH